MGGGKSKTSQVQEYLSESLTNVVDEQITEESTNLSQAGYTNQLITNVTFKPWDGCPWWSPPQNLNVTQESVSAGIIAKSIERINSAELSNKISSKIESLSGNKVEKRKDGLLAFTDSTDTDQRISVSSKTRTNIERRIKETVQTIINQRYDTQQTISGTTFYLPCGDNNVTQKSVTKVMASVFGKNITETVMEASEVRDWVSKVTSEDKQHSTDPFNSLFSNAASAINGISGAVGSIGSAYANGIAMVVVLIIVLMMMPSGGGHGGRHSDD